MGGQLLSPVKWKSQADADAEAGDEDMYWGTDEVPESRSSKPMAIEDGMDDKPKTLPPLGMSVCPRPKGPGLTPRIMAPKAPAGPPPGLRPSSKSGGPRQPDGPPPASGKEWMTKRTRDLTQRAAKKPRTMRNGKTM